MREARKVRIARDISRFKRFSHVAAHFKPEIEKAINGGAMDSFRFGTFQISFNSHYEIFLLKNFVLNSEVRLICELFINLINLE